ncbi:hypothetical protein [Algivirga pacifica]|uniref:Uncharacterized protein n=1 Tax=Algivirga pacifica TaxID=1162670 RepID=A0ABP9DC23_9BACT
MPFKSISIDAYITQQKQLHPTIDTLQLKKDVETALNDFHADKKCSCGNDIWVLGSVGKERTCFSCMLGTTPTTNDLEIEGAEYKGFNCRTGRHMDDAPLEELSGYFDDDGFELNPDIAPKPTLCSGCIHDGHPFRGIVCKLFRMGQIGGEEFQCCDFQADK